MHRPDQPRTGLIIAPKTLPDSNATYADAAQATPRAAILLFGDKSAERSAVQQAWTETGGI